MKRFNSHFISNFKENLDHFLILEFKTSIGEICSKNDFGDESNKKRFDFSSFEE